MPVPGGEITGSEIWAIQAVKPGAEEEASPEPCECDDGCEGCTPKQ